MMDYWKSPLRQDKWSHLTLNITHLKEPEYLTISTEGQIQQVLRSYTVALLGGRHQSQGGSHSHALEAPHPGPGGHLCDPDRDPKREAHRAQKDSAQIGGRERLPVGRPNPQPSLQRLTETSAILCLRAAASVYRAECTPPDRAAAQRGGPYRSQYRPGNTRGGGRRQNNRDSGLGRNGRPEGPYANSPSD